MADEGEDPPAEDAPAEDPPEDAPAEGEPPKPPSNIPTYEQIEECANFIKEATNTTAKIAVIAGSSMGVLPKCCLSGSEATCTNIPNIGACLAADDDCAKCPNIVYSGMAGTSPVLAITGRPHIVHENTMVAKTAQFVKSFKLIGVEMMILICAAGALNEKYKVGDIMIIKDHVNFMGLAGYNPLMGKYDDKFGPKYLSMNSTYNESLRKALKQALKDASYTGNISEGVYVAVTGPVYPTPAEKTFLRAEIVGDAVGMYLIPEILLSKFCGLEVLAMCVITEEARPGPGESNFDEVENTIGQERMGQLNTAIENLIQKLDSADGPTAAVRGMASTGPCCALGSNVTDATTIQYESIPHFPTSETSIGKIIAGNMVNTPVLVFKGRYHIYDGYTMQQCTMHIKVLKLLGVKVLITINSSGGINQDYKIGDIMLVKDHINLQGFAGQNPLIGPNDERFGPRFIPMNKVYDKDLLGKAKKILDEIKFEGTIHEGVYATISGPAYDTMSENLFLQTCGVDAVGLTIIPEVLVAKHSGMSIVAFSIITDQGIMDENNDKEINHDEMIEIYDRRTEQLNEFLEKFVKIAVFSKEEGDTERGDGSADGDEEFTKSSKRKHCKCKNLD